MNYRNLDTVLNLLWLAALGVLIGFALGCWMTA